MCLLSNRVPANSTNNESIPRQVTDAEQKRILWLDGLGDKPFNRSLSVLPRELRPDSQRTERAKPAPFSQARLHFDRSVRHSRREFSRAWQGRRVNLCCLPEEPELGKPYCVD